MSKYRVVISKHGRFDGHSFKPRYIVQLRIRIMWVFTFWTNVTQIDRYESDGCEKRYRVSGYDSIKEAEKEIKRLEKNNI